MQRRLAAAAQRGQQGADLRVVDPPCARQHRGGPAGRTHRIRDAEADPAGYAVGTSSARRSRDDEPHRLDQVRGDVPEQAVAFDRRLPRDAELAGRDVAKAAVRELARPPARATGEVTLLDENGA